MKRIILSLLLGLLVLGCGSSDNENTDPAWVMREKPVTHDS